MSLPPALLLGRRGRVFLAACAGFAALGFVAQRARAVWPPPRTQTQVRVIVDFTAAGRRLAHPDAKHPSYYFPVITPFQQLGALVRNEPPPDLRDVVHAVAVELARQGYFVGIPPRRPDLILSIHFGCLNPVVVDSGGAGSSPPTMGAGGPQGESPSGLILNQNQMLDLLAGTTLRNLDLSSDMRELWHDAKQNEYFVMVSAFDYDDYAHHHRKVLLWQAKMSVPSHGVRQFADAMDALVKAGGPYFGRETKRPQVFLRPITPEGQVEVGTPTVKQ